MTPASLIFTTGGKKFTQLWDCKPEIILARILSLTEITILQVRALLDKLDVAETYYASGKMFRTDHAAVGSAEFNARVKCLCMWYVQNTNIST